MGVETLGYSYRRRYSKHIETAVKYRRSILNSIITDKNTSVKSDEKNISCEAKAETANKITRKQRYLTPTERDEVVAKYADGLNMAEIARRYGCHVSTVRKLLRDRGVVILSKSELQKEP